MATTGKVCFVSVKQVLPGCLASSWHAYLAVHSLRQNHRSRNVSECSVVLLSCHTSCLGWSFAFESSPPKEPSERRQATKLGTQIWNMSSGLSGLGLTSH